MKIRLHALSGMVVALTLTSPPIADRDCRIAAERREAAVAQVIDALRAYEKCILSGQKQDDCAGQLDELDSAHDEFADAVSEYIIALVADQFLDAAVRVVRQERDAPIAGIASIWMEGCYQSGALWS
jgi:hypothetical protein